MDGDEIRALRKAAGLTQAQLAALAGVGRHAVSYWEGRANVPLHQYAPRRMLKVLGVEVVPYFAPGAYGRAGDEVLLPGCSGKATLRTTSPQKGARISRTICSAKTRRGTPCRAKSEPGRARCKFHGGRSTGPRTEEGKARISEAQKLRWELWRMARTTENPKHR
jgi:transcriptional regulator with XRE-family HTH domain